MALEKLPSFQEVKDWAASKTELNNHINDTSNPHNVNTDAPVDDVNGQTGSVNIAQSVGNGTEVYNGTFDYGGDDSYNNTPTNATIVYVRGYINNTTTADVETSLSFGNINLTNICGIYSNSESTVSGIVPSGVQYNAYVGSGDGHESGGIYVYEQDISVS